MSSTFDLGRAVYEKHQETHPGYPWVNLSGRDQMLWNDAAIATVAALARVQIGEFTFGIQLIPVKGESQ